MASVEASPGMSQVQEVLAKGPIPNPTESLEEARNDAARLERIREIRKQIDEKGIQ